MALNWVEIDLAALRHNYDQARKRIGSGTRILAVVKSDAYGHGMIPVARELSSAGVDFFGVSKFWEAAALREAGLSEPILVLLGVEPGEMEEAIRQEIRPAIFRPDHAQALAETARRLGTTAKVHVKVDTGMGRLGVPMDELDSFLEVLRDLPALNVEGVFSHFSVADEEDKTYSLQQMGRFRVVLERFEQKGVPFTYAHISNSAALLDLPDAHLHLVRPGIMLYGSPPSDALHHPADLRPVMSLKSRILQLKWVPKGRPIGYGRTYISPDRKRIATIPVGYDDGYPRLLSNKGSVLIRGRRAPVVGRVSMNMITVDVTHIDSVQPDDEVVLMGAQGEERITGDEIAALCGTISYEIFCSMGRNPHRVFLHSSGDLAT